ncbi:MAG: CheB methylesterase [Polyangiaceae bacterium]|jgi:two-component system chemotaxis response regulator CheB|nr:CheB methylesterase [Polyangiaceae bacterium]
MTKPRVIVIGASAGGLDALSRLAAQLPPDLGAAVFIVQHMSADADGGALRRAVTQSGNLVCDEARDGAPFHPGRAYLARSDHHLLLVKGKMLVTKGARENRSRPGIDPLFRSAAVAYGNRVIGVVLTGYLDDGTAGMMAIKRCGGICVVQDPADAAYPDMPQNVLNHVKVDHVVPLAAMGALLVKLLSRPVRKARPVPADVAIEARIAERVLSDLPSVEAVGDQVPFNCPGCGGVLWEVAKGGLLRYRCHTGHAYTSAVLLAEQTAKIEETLWSALRMFEERRNLLKTMGGSNTNGKGYSTSAAARAKESEVHIDRIRAMLKSSAAVPSGRVRRRP